MTEAYTRMIEAMMESGQEMLRAFNPGLEGMKVGGFDKLFPTMPADIMEMWFGKTFNREGLDARTRLLVTLAGLTVQGAVVPAGLAEPQLRLTIRHALEAGASEREIAEVIWQMSMFGGLPAMRQALEIAQAVFDENKEANT
ncbi:carboxymuconolactone decarboxylase family protein [Pseudogemmobacter humi]|uniref:Carboxymuconolactone decarboxylase family protein n=1 Tax=Pseudogemmobacter humi TaxID=2483812 RepID=A0A3P5XAQ9_9RHOB|nr:carboxymuconolactone decarboxylase family protein [Pseudogemmobacter humi]VDC31698.1 Carboxymuconolactone decarboxylase family protein [Pseudogemmobacter humi]